MLGHIHHVTYQSVHSCTPSFQVTLENLPVAQGVQLYRGSMVRDTRAK